MPIHKVSTFLSKISTFFKKDSAEGAMFTIMSVIKGIKMYEQTLFGRKSRCNSVYSLLHVFQLLLVCPCSMIRNPFSVIGLPLGGKLVCGKDVFYDFTSSMTPAPIGASSCTISVRSCGQRSEYAVTTKPWTPA